MIVRFDSLNRFEVPKFFVCNPGCTYDNGVLSNTLGCLSDTTDEELVLNFNTTSELNFRLNKIYRSDAEENRYVLNLYKSIQNRRLIFVEDVGFFVIRDVTDGFEAGLHYKDVRAESCEYEISQKSLPYIEGGTYKFLDLFERIVASLPLWKIGDVNLDVAEKWRTFDEINIESNTLSFLLEDMQDAYECIFLMDTTNRLIHVYDQNYFVEQTNIHITKDDLIESVEIKESSDDLYTAINVQGNENLNISPVNPLGSNVIYNFDYYLDWMTPGLAAKVRSWDELVRFKSETYYNLNLQYYNRLTDKSRSSADIEMLKTQLNMYKRMRDNIVAEGATTTVESYNKIIEENGGVPVGINLELSGTIAEIDTLIEDAKAKIEQAERIFNQTEADLEMLIEQITTIRNEVSVLNYFTDAEYAELSNYIYEGNYTDEYITVTESMTYAERFQQMKTLYDRAIAQLIRISEPIQEFSIDVENFLFIKEFAEWSAQLKTGCLINVELDTDDIASLFLSNITINYDDKELSMTFGNRFNRFDPKAMFNNVLGNIKKSSNSINYIKEILYPVTNEFDVMKEAIESSQILTKNMALTSEDQEIIIDDTGILCRKSLGNGEYDPKQIKVTNQTIVFTDDGWDTSRTGIGNFVFNSPFTGETEEHYGVIADTLIGNLVLSQEVGIYNTDNSITLDKNGFTLTTDQTGSSESQNVFTIQKKLLNESGNEYYEKQLYIDDDGNVVLNGSISIFAGPGSGNTSIGEIITSVESNDSKIQDLENELQEQADAIAGLDGIFFFVRYSDNENGIPMYESPTDSTLYMGTCSTNTDVAPIDPAEYTWVRIRSDSADGTPGLDGTSQYFHIKYSNDGRTFTDNNGEELGDWMGTCVTEEKDDPTDFNAYEWHKIKGEPGTDGLDGKDGIPGKDGSDGKTTYFHVKYSSVENPAFTSDMSDIPNKYIGTYVDYAETDSLDPKEYTWSKFIGDDGKDGTDGVPGTNGIDGKTYYLHIKYSNDGGMCFTDNDGEDPGEYIGVYTNTVQEDSTDPSDYTWSLIKGADGIPGKDGADGKTTYFHIKYSNIAAPTITSDLTEIPSKYIGTYVDYTEADSTNPADYKWTQFIGDNGTDGLPGANGIDGKTYYLHIKYSDDGGLTFTANNGETSGQYIGVYTDTTQGDSDDVTKYTWSLIKGADGIPGKDGTDGKTTYFHVKYSNIAYPQVANDMTEEPSKYIGTYVDYTEEDSTNPYDYKWVKFMGEDGTDGIPGENGIDGKTYYLHIKYSDDGGNTFTGNLLSSNPDDWQSGLIGASGTINSAPQTSSSLFLCYASYSEVIQVSPGETYTVIRGDSYTLTFRQYGSSGTYSSDYVHSIGVTTYVVPAGIYYIRAMVCTNYSNFADISSAIISGEINPQVYRSSEQGEETGKYIGVYTDTTEADSTNPSDYKWSLIKGENGSDGTTYYTWIKYADTPTSGMSDSPDGKKYMGLAYNKTESTESTNYSDYTWSLIKGEDGTDGINGINGIDGKTYYTWVKYADDASGTNMTNDPTGKEYIGLAYNKDTSTESNDPADYSWALFKGSDGVNGQDGTDGISCYFYVRYSANANGSSMTTSPTDTTQYMGVCSTTSPTAPTSYSSYTWTRCKGEDGTNGTPGQAGADGRTQYLHIKYSDDGETFTGNIIPGLTSSSFENGGFEEIAGAPEDSDYKIRIPSLVDIDGSTEYLFTTNYDGTSFELFLYYGENKTYLEKMVSLANGETCILNDYASGLEITAVEISIVSTSTISVETYDSYVANGFIPEIRSVDSSGEKIGAYIGTLVDFTEADSTTFSDYTWKKFTEDVDEELQELQDQLDHKTNVLEETIQNTVDGLHSEIQSGADEINNRIDKEISNINQSITDQVNSVSSAINEKYDTLMSDVEDQLTAHKAEVGQYMTFNDSGLTLGATSSEFKTVIDNVGMYFKQGDAVVSYVNNKQLYIPNAVIESTLILGNFFFSPRDDGGFSLTWQE